MSKHDGFALHARQFSPMAGTLNRISHLTRQAFGVLPPWGSVTPSASLRTLGLCPWAVSSFMYIELTGGIAAPSLQVDRLASDTESYPGPERPPAAYVARPRYVPPEAVVERRRQILRDVSQNVDCAVDDEGRR